MAVSDATELRKFTFVFIITKKIDVILYLYLYCRDESKQWEGKTSSKRDNKIDLCVYNSQDCRARKLTYMLMLQCLISNSSLLWKKEKCEGNKTWDDFSQSKYPLNGNKIKKKCPIESLFRLKIFPNQNENVQGKFANSETTCDSKHYSGASLQHSYRLVGSPKITASLRGCLFIFFIQLFNYSYSVISFIV